MGQKNGFYLPFRATTKLDHFGDINGMVIDLLTAVKAGCTGFGDYLLKVPVVAVVKYFGKIAARPKLVTSIVGSPNPPKW